MERPLNDIRKLITANLDIVSAELEDIKKHPLVISTRPSSEPCIKFLGKFNNIHNLLTAISNMMLLFIIIATYDLIEHLFYLLIALFYLYLQMVVGVQFLS